MWPCFSPVGGTSSPRECPPSVWASGPSSSSPKPGISGTLFSNNLDKNNQAHVRFKPKRPMDVCVIPFSIRALILPGVPTPMCVTPFCSRFAASSICTDKKKKKIGHCARSVQLQRSSTLPWCVWQRALSLLLHPWRQSAVCKDTEQKGVK